MTEAQRTPKPERPSLAFSIATSLLTMLTLLVGGGFSLGMAVRAFEIGYEVLG